MKKSTSFFRLQLVYKIDNSSNIAGSCPDQLKNYLVNQLKSRLRGNYVFSNKTASVEMRCSEEVK